MIAVLLRRDRLEVPALVLAVIVFGALVALRPALPLAVIGLVFMIGLACIPPVPHLLLLVAVTAIVPFGLQNRYGIPVTALLPFNDSVSFSGAGSPSIFLSDALLLAGLLRVVPSLLGRRLERRLALPTACVLIFLLIAAAQLIRSLATGRDPSTVGAEFRVLLGFSTFLLALPVVTNQDHRRQLVRYLPFVGLAIGLWGIGQWTLQLGFSEAGDAGIREGVRFTSAGVGQIQGSVFAYPVAALLALAGLASGRVRTLRARVLLVAVAVLNGVSLLLTYERTFWLATAIGFAFILVKAQGAQRLRAVTWVFVLVALGSVALVTLAPNELKAARERLVSLRQYRTDSSVHYRLTESRHAASEIGEHPVIGSGYGATIFWGRPWALVPPSSFRYIHNGYLWLAWRLGIPGALALWTALLSALVWRRSVPGEPFYRILRDGSQGALLAILVASLTFPSFNQLSITAAMGLLLAIACTPPLAESSDERPS